MLATVPHLEKYTELSWFCQGQRINASQHSTVHLMPACRRTHTMQKHDKHGQECSLPDTYRSLQVEASAHLIRQNAGRALALPVQTTAVSTGGQLTANSKPYSESTTVRFLWLFGTRGESCLAPALVPRAFGGLCPDPFYVSCGCRTSVLPRHVDLADCGQFTVKISP